MFDLVFETAAMCRYEQDAAALRAGGVSLTADRLAGLWRARVEPYFGSATAPDGWIQWPHPYGARFYNYQYSFAFLCSFGLAALRRADPAGFGERYTAMLRAGGSLPPAELLAICGLDLAGSRPLGAGAGRDRAPLRRGLVAGCAVRCSASRCWRRSGAAATCSTRSRCGSSAPA